MSRFVLAAALLVTFAASVQAAAPIVTTTTTNVQRCPVESCYFNIVHPAVRR